MATVLPFLNTAGSNPCPAFDLIKAALRLINAIAPGETPTATEANDGLVSLNDLLETMSTESLSVYGQANQTFSTVSGQATYTIGAGADWDTARPINIDDAFCSLNGIDYPVKPWSQEDYNAIILKTQQQGIVERLLYVNDNPFGLVTLYPVPADVMPITLSMRRILDSIPDLSTVLIYPPGYLLYMRYALAILMAPDYGRTVAQEIRDVHNVAKGNISRANIPRRYAKFDSALLGDGGGANWQRGC